VTKPKIPDLKRNNLHPRDERVKENSQNNDLHLHAERDLILRNMKIVYDVGTQILAELDTEIDDLRIKLRNS